MNHRFNPVLIVAQPEDRLARLILDQLGAQHKCSEKPPRIRRSKRDGQLGIVRAPGHPEVWFELALGPVGAFNGRIVDWLVVTSPSVPGRRLFTVSARRIGHHGLAPSDTCAAHHLVISTRAFEQLPAGNRTHRLQTIANELAAQVVARRNFRSRPQPRVLVGCP